ncbi:hypothetical protein FC83_GL002038 [Agrilactobacillus composti DSM 18527 = JCM 14202]|jgi:hypothetical protein|uniref:Uncharacterized protein n=1 Tax=Agrilactobacillus composti DSM 18527 = JCM 14202 TaxID=1423734 RepID=X0PD84_9LACO|nr:hypothetical protein [Agrilactobacillus composti]KRM34898.1 hypothetical protein FC83_GL002038 [Agrilactobacillus composti DSM 18527 = JCM 14202]MCH4169966.1 hypothetical protein [Lactobacillus sp.]GAF38773.1 hypothetical protein JCM14202_603 [Agrilactobacillus composti DSM 18527 = JCM 14202]
MNRAPHFVRGILCIIGAFACALVIFLEFSRGILGIGPVRVAKLGILVFILLAVGLRDLFHR